MHNQLRGCVKINARGRNLYRFINMIHSGRVYCFGQYCRRDVFYCEIYRHDLAKLQDFAEKCGVELKYYECETLSKKLLRYRKRIGIAFGAAVVLGLSIYFSGIIITIDIQGNSSVSDRVILAALEELDIKQGSYMKDINFAWCENELRLMVDDIAWAGIRRTGNRVVVEVTEIVKKPEMVQERMPCNVVAGKSAQITSTTVHDGMLMRIVGDYVREGDMLISGVTSDAAGHITKHHAMGIITGIYEETAVFTGEFRQQLYLPTGSVSEERYIKLMNLKIPLFIGKNHYKSCTAESNERQLSFFGRMLPVSVIENRLAETSLSEKEYTQEELEAELMGKIYLYEKNFLSDVRIIEREIVSEQNENSLTYTVTYTVEGDIGVQREIFIK